MKDQLQDQITELLDVIDRPCLSSEGEHIENEAQEEHLSTVYLVLVDDEEERDQQPYMVEGSIQGEPGEAVADALQPRSIHYPAWVRIVAFLGLVAFFGPALLVPVGVPVLHLPVTVLIQPAIAQVEQETNLILPARPLSVPTLSQSKTIPTTGSGYQQARVSSGLVTLYNPLPTPQFVQAGMIITSSSGVQIATDQSVNIPGALAPTMGEMNVSAHALLPGPDGNITAFDINGLSSVAYILAKNHTAFTGGQEARTYQVVAEKDVDQAVDGLKTSLQKNIQTLFSAQLGQGETLITPACEPSISTDKQIGQEAKAVKVTAELTCRAIAYSIEALQKAIAQRLDQQALRELGTSYTLVGSVESTVTGSTKKQQFVILSVKATGNYVYKFSQDQLAHFKTQIAGKSKAEAKGWLELQAGVQGVGIDQDHLPPTIQSIQFLLESSK